MNAVANQQFEKMDALSMQGTPFFFMVDFLVENVEIYSEKELHNSGLLVDFHSFKNDNQLYAATPEFDLKSYPEPFENYLPGFLNVQNHIRKGNSYLVNYTRKTEIKTNLSLEEIFRSSKAPYKVLSPEKFVFFSPETFVKIADNEIFTFPMKGTADASLPDAKERLFNNFKEKAEHFTVVDLLRNDLSIVTDQVKVDDFGFIEPITTGGKNLLAMSSKISGAIKPAFRQKIGSILKNLLPAGSILGAPKEKTLKIILESEGYSRGFYSGVCGWFDGKNLDSCVMIRFIEQENGKLFFKSGGGITHLSKPLEEYNEMISKIYVPIY